MTVFKQLFSSALSFKEHPAHASAMEHSTQTSCPEHPAHASAMEHSTQISCPEHPAQTSCPEHTSQAFSEEHSSRASSRLHLSQQSGPYAAVDAGAGAVKTAEQQPSPLDSSVGCNPGISILQSNDLVLSSRASSEGGQTIKRGKSPGSSLTKTLRGALKTGLSAAAFMTAVVSFNTANAAIPVMDASALNESVMQRIISIEQWARDNINQARQIQELLSGNNIAHDTQNLMDRNYVMDSKESWQNIARIKEQSLSMLYASRSAWEEFGSAQQYLASFQKASAWSKCMQAGNCSFSRVLTELEDSTISQAMEAFEMSQSMNIKLQEQIDQVQALVVESQSTASQAGTLDALSKINGSAALSMIDLNNQIALLTRLQSHDLARQSNVRLAQEGYLKEITRHVERAPDRLPLQSFMQRH